MAWLQAEQGMVNHPKTAELAVAFGWNKYEAAGRLLSFLSWCLEYAPTGEVGKYNDAVLAGSVGLDSKDGAKFVRSMVEARWLDRRDETLLVHDWRDYAGRYLQESKFKHHPDKWAEVCRFYPKPWDVQGQSKDSPSYQQRGPTKPTHQGARKRAGGAAGKESLLDAIEKPLLSKANANGHTRRQ
jgi:hypothetical protein